MLCSMYSILIRSLSRYLPSKFVYLFNWKAALCIFLKYVRTKSNSYSYVWVGICRGFLVSHYTSMCLGLLYDLLYNNNAFFKLCSPIHHLDPWIMKSQQKVGRQHLQLKWQFVLRCVELIGVHLKKKIKPSQI